MLTALVRYQPDVVAAAQPGSRCIPAESLRGRVRSANLNLPFIMWWLEGHPHAMLFLIN